MSRVCSGISNKMTKHICIDKKENCCGCAACLNICPVEAIHMFEDKFGYVYPEVNKERCIECGKCSECCTFSIKGSGENGSSNIYVGKNIKQDVLVESSSGGIFSAIAEMILDSNGVVFGAAWNKDCEVEHICVNTKAELRLLRGSKYVQSNIGSTFQNVKKTLEAGVTVCFVGTPCQVSGLKSYLGRPYNTLLTIDIVCHGVPNQKMLKEDLSRFSRKYNVQPIVVKFRDKKNGWGTQGSVSDGHKTLKYNAMNSPYYFYFLKGELYRPSCYNCRFPSEGRQGDVTIGDYWGVNINDERVLGDARMGISCVIVNTQKGKVWIENSSTYLRLSPSTKERISIKNGQLIECSRPTYEHESLLNDYELNGYDAIVQHFKKKKKDRIILYIKSKVPSKIKRLIAFIRGK